MESFCSDVLGLRLSSLRLQASCFISSIASSFWTGRRAQVKGRVIYQLIPIPHSYFELISELQKGWKNCIKNLHTLFVQIFQMFHSITLSFFFSKYIHFPPEPCMILLLPLKYLCFIPSSKNIFLNNAVQ